MDYYLIFALLFLGLALSLLIYIIGQVATLPILVKISKGRKVISVVLALVLLAALTLLLSLAFNNLSALLIFAHFILFWLISWLMVQLLRIKPKDRKKNLTAVLAILITAAYFTYAWINANHVVPTRYSIKSGKKITPLKIVQFSDVHLGITIRGQELNKIIEKINSEKPDLVLITGDLIDHKTSKADLISGIQALGNLKSTYGTYFSYGNHDRAYFADQVVGWDSKDFEKALSAAHVTLLQDESKVINPTLRLIGRDETGRSFDGETRKNMAELMNNSPNSPIHPYTIVMDHKPTAFEEESEAKVDLVLSGHSHNGQLLPIKYMDLVLGDNDRWYGHEKRQQTDFIVSSGMGSWGVPFKTGAKSEYVVIDLH